MTKHHLRGHMMTDAGIVAHPETLTVYFENGRWWMQDLQYGDEPIRAAAYAVTPTITGVHVVTDATEREMAEGRYGFAWTFSTEPEECARIGMRVTVDA